MLKQKPLLAVALFAVVSTLWSQAPLITLRRSIALSLTFAFAWYFATYYPPADQKRMLLATGVILGSASIAWVIVFPAYGIATSGEFAGEWKGVFGQKNVFATTMIAFFSILPFRDFPNLRRLLVVIFQAIFPLFLIVKAHSRQSLILVVLFVGVRIFGPVIARIRKERLPFILYLTVWGIAGVVFGWGMILSFLGKGAVASWAGRIREWSPVVPYILRRLWFGYGYYGFWTGHGDSLIVMKRMHVTLLGSDSGYTDNMLSFGLVGMSILLIVVLASVRDFLRLLRLPAVPIIAFWYVGFTLITWVEAVIDNTFPMPSYPHTFLFVVACSGLTSLFLRAKRSALASG